jgi:hypothetical protein
MSLSFFSLFSFIVYVITYNSIGSGLSKTPHQFAEKNVNGKFSLFNPLARYITGEILG